MSTAPQLLETYKMYIDGKWMESASGDYFESDNPYTGRPWALIPKGNAGDVDRAPHQHRRFRHSILDVLTLPLALDPPIVPAAAVDVCVVHGPCVCLGLTYVRLLIPWIT